MSQDRVKTCDALFCGYSPGTDPSDKTGCVKPDGHSGTHKFKSEDGKWYEWEYDLDCECGCMDSDDFSEVCIVYTETEE